MKIPARINRDTRAALACALRIQGQKLETVALFGGFPSAKVEPGIYDRVGGRWVLRADGGSVALQHRAMSYGRLATDFERMERNRRKSEMMAAASLAIGEWRDRGIRERLAADRASGRIGRRS